MKKFTPPEQFQSHFLESGAFAHLNSLFKLCTHNNWPSFEWLNSLNNIKNSQGFTVQFEPDSLFCDEQRYYEQIIYETGRIPTREQSWHDLFGALIWCLFPKTKALLNQRHIHEINQYGLKQRSKHRNALTLFDECGVVLAITNESVQAQLRAHKWHSVFIDNRKEWGTNIHPFIFGHANYEMLTQPFIGLTGKALCIIVDSGFAELSLAEQYAVLDEKLYVQITEQAVLNDNQQMSPLPLLGVPNWYDDNNNPQFYDNTNYFRKKRELKKES
jgi:hypothetical protein